MLKFLSRVVVEYNPLDPRKAAAVELLAQCNGRKAKDSNPTCSVELRRPAVPRPRPTTPRPSRPARPHHLPQRRREAFVAADGATAQGMRDQILARSRLLEPSSSSARPGRSGPSSSPRRSSACHSLGSSQKKARKPQAA
ncbi:hypothetical protein ZWY2020_025896 [Hordeum vulgare]|nr:hypothetical protein ZWY2020_025896 [Hordeum vulgare]